jgi:alanyl-tRNA synthetase
VTPDQVKAGRHAGNLVKALAASIGGGGGGRPDFAEAGGKQPEKIDEMLEASEKVLRKLVESAT